MVKYPHPFQTKKIVTIINHGEILLVNHIEKPLSNIIQPQLNFLSQIDKQFGEYSNMT